MDRKPFLKSGIITLLAGLSLTAAFAATGFIAAFAREQFLGINLSDWSTQSLTVLAGRCLADSFFLVLNLAARHWVILTIVIVLIAAGVVTLRHRTFPLWVAPAAECVLAVPLLIWLLVALITFEAPTVPLRGWIVAATSDPLRAALEQLHLRGVTAAATAEPPPAPAPEPAAAPPPQTQSAPNPQARPRRQGGRQNQAAPQDQGTPQDQPAATDQAAPSAMPESTPGSAAAMSPGVTQLSDYYFSGQSDGPGVLLLESSSNQLAKQLAAAHFPYHNRNQAKNLLFSGYASAVAACLIAMLYLLLLPECPESKVWSDLLTVLRAAVIVASAVTTVLLPYVYGKVVDSALFPNCHIVYLEPSTDKPNGDATIKKGEYPVVSRNDKSVSLLWVQKHRGFTRIIEVPRDKILSLTFVADVDALAKVSDCIAKAGAECQ
ncbi:MAG TPA: hypothetical protein VG225_17125 [Terracidiphilus sp.]|jgi:hypothetical protein|nr:hypothetical protein [Terracidiphilus sp.]